MKYYEYSATAITFISVIPLMFHENCEIFNYINLIAVSFFICDYVVKWIISSIRGGVESFYKYPFSVSALLDLVVILSYFNIVSTVFKATKFVKIGLVLGSTRALKVLKKSKNFNVLCDVISEEKEILTAVFSLICVYVFVTSIIIFNVEPESFKNFFDAIYYSAITLTTVGYGDICPKTEVGRVISVLSSFIGIAIMTIPTGIITAGYVKKIS